MTGWVMALPPKHTDGNLNEARHGHMELKDRVIKNLPLALRRWEMFPTVNEMHDLVVVAGYYDNHLFGIPEKV